MAAEVEVALAEAVPVDEEDLAAVAAVLVVVVVVSEAVVVALVGEEEVLVDEGEALVAVAVVSAGAEANSVLACVSNRYPQSFQASIAGPRASRLTLTKLPQGKKFSERYADELSVAHKLHACFLQLINSSCNYRYGCCAWRSAACQRLATSSRSTPKTI